MNVTSFVVSMKSSPTVQNSQLTVVDGSYKFVIGSVYYKRIGPRRQMLPCFEASQNICFPNLWSPI